ncbi:hypothetical protein TNCT_420311 [Trichonephila clavata]|uniref:Uncharacterized protein n=1 Tax=Trichonephila clavata TaxID=2740835 RepID=A0A8X6HGF7_TRICU|nr:hypothetical protein TNCT_420311 [Trichonephila clavata]
MPTRGLRTPCRMEACVARQSLKYSWTVLNTVLLCGWMHFAGVLLSWKVELVVRDMPVGTYMCRGFNTALLSGSFVVQLRE